jgi:membrane protein
MVGVASVLGFVLSFAGLTSRQIQADILSVIPEAARADAEAALTGARQASGLLLLVALAGLLWTGAGLFGTMEQAFAVIFHTPPRGFVRQKLMGFGMMLLFMLLAGLAVGSSLILPALRHVPFIPAALGNGPAALGLQVAMGGLSGFLLFAAIYYVVPNRRQRLSRVVPGALVAAVAFEAVTLLFPLYLQFNKGLQAYGKTFGLFLVLLAFFYFLGVITMIGVEVNSVLYPVPVDHPEPVDEDATTGTGSRPAPAGIGILRNRFVQAWAALGALAISWAMARSIKDRTRG